MLRPVPAFVFAFTLISYDDVLSRQVTPEVFEPGIISTASVEIGASFSADMDEFYFTRCSGKWAKNELKCSILVSKRINGTWCKPAVASFSGMFNDSDPHVTADGNTLYFISERPGGSLRVSADIWRVRRTQNGAWGEAVRLPDPVNSPGREYSPRTTGNGDLYFASDRDGGYGQGDLYRAGNHAGAFRAPVNLGSDINSPLGEWNLEISDDGGILIFEASQREQNRSSYGDLYISFRSDTGWTRPQNMTEINTTGSDLYPELIHDNATLLYSSSQALENDTVTIYEVDFTPLLRKYRSRAAVP